MTSCQLSLLVIDQLRDVTLDAYVVSQLAVTVANGGDRQVVDKCIAVFPEVSTKGQKTQPDRRLQEQQQQQQQQSQ
jgi:hypothetical protein